MAKVVTITNPVTGQPAQVDQLDHTAQQIDDAVEAARWSHRNLLDNAYWANPDAIIDQRGGYVVPPNTPYYSDTGLTTQAGTVSAYTKATNVNSTYGIITVSGTTYYVAWSAAVRGYTGAGYGIDRWKSLNDNLSIIINLDGTITLKNNTAFDSWFVQLLDIPESFQGEKLTLSVLGTAKTGNCYINLYDGTDNLVAVTENGISTSTKVVGASATVLQFVFYIQGNSELTIKAVKLELGSQQTLAHQDESGNWVLNEIPDYGEQLRRCQRYFMCYKAGTVLPCVAYSEQNGWYLDAALPITGMRTSPVHNIGDGLSCSVRNINSDPDFISKTISDWGHYSGVQILRIAGGENTSATWPYIIRMDADLTFSADL